jgi:hypothetical protein
VISVLLSDVQETISACEIIQHDCSSDFVE